MLQVEIIDHTSKEGEAYIFQVPLGTPWGEVEAAVKLLYPEAEVVTFRLLQE